MKQRQFRAQPNNEEIENTLSEARHRAGISASQLAESVGLSRQAIYAIEAGTYVPNTAVSLRLARSLGVAITELFQLPETMPEPERRLFQVISLPGDRALKPDDPVQLSRVHGRLIASLPPDSGPYLPSNDALVAKLKLKTGRVAVSVRRDGAEVEDRLLIAGCDPAASILARYLHTAGTNCILVHRNSSESLDLLKQGYIHVAGSHLHDGPGCDTNLATARSSIGRTPVAVISFARWQQSLIFARKNLKHISGLADLARKEVRFVNREQGSGSRLLVEKKLKELGLPANRVRSFDCVARSHLEAAREVLNGRADCCVAPEAAARLLGLAAIPFAEESYDFVLRGSDLKHPAVERLFNVIAQGKLQRELHDFAGYDMKAAGNRVA